MAFKIFKIKKEVGSKTVTSFICKDGPNGTGVTLPYTCGFCKDKDGRPTVAFRSWKERIKHANDCSAK